MRSRFLEGIYQDWMVSCLGARSQADWYTSTLRCAKHLWIPRFRLPAKKAQA